MTADAYVQSVIDHLPPRMGLREQIAMEVRSHIAERLEHGQPLDAVLGQFGDPQALAESYLAAVPLRSARVLRRAAAKLIDFVAVVAVAAGLSLALWLVSPQQLRNFVPLLCILACFLGFFGYTVYAEYRAGQTIGKRLLGIHVVRESGARISLGQSFIRQLPLLGQIFIIDILFAVFTKHKQRAFELITKTRAVVAILYLVVGSQ
jgi:uncharacterized RDD family membrane protein YckC